MTINAAENTHLLQVTRILRAVEGRRRWREKRFQPGQGERLDVTPVRRQRRSEERRGASPFAGGVVGHVAEAHGAKVVRHPYNLGNGAAIKSGVRAASGDIIVLMDSDGQHPADRIPAHDAFQRLARQLPFFDLEMARTDEVTRIEWRYLDGEDAP